MQDRANNQSGRGRNSDDKSLENALTSCLKRGAQITPLREAALTALWNANGPVGAYELKNQLSDVLGRTISATSIYRTLNFLCENGVAARIESRNAYVPCEHPEHDHTCVLFICDDCGSSAEIENPKLENLLAADANALGFKIGHRVVELSGACANCSQSSA